MSSRGPWMQVGAEGRPFYPLSPDPGEVHLEDIVPALSRICRFGGHCRQFYSVAQHSVLVSQLVPREYAIEALLHDAAEAYTGDVVRPMKDAIRTALSRFRPGGDRIWSTAIERIESVVAMALGMTWPTPAIVKRADLVALATEARDVMPDPRMPWGDLPAPDPRVILPLPPERAEAQWWARYHEIRNVYTKEA